MIENKVNKVVKKYQIFADFRTLFWSKSTDTFFLFIDYQNFVFPF
jgi:hypothetical protein